MVRDHTAALRWWAAPAAAVGPRARQRSPDAAPARSAPNSSVLHTAPATVAATCHGRRRIGVCGFVFAGVVRAREA